MWRKKLEDSFIVALWSWVFYNLQERSLFYRLNKTVQAKFRASEGNKSYAWTDAVVLISLVLAILFWIVSTGDHIKWWEWLLISYGVLEIYNVFVYHVNVVFFDEYRARKAGEPFRIRSYRRMLICLLHNYFEIIFLFAMFYRILEFCFESGSICPNSVLGSLYFSVVTMSTLGYGDITPLNKWGVIICGFQTLIGLFMVLVMLASFIRLLPIAKSMDWLESDD